VSAAARRTFLLSALLFAAPGCAVTQLTPPDAAQVRESERAVLENVRRLRSRLFRISYTLRTRALRLCGEHVLPDAGLLLQEGGEAEAAGLDVLYVVSGSPLEVAGVQAGDVVLDIEGDRTLQVPAFNRAVSKVRRAHLTLRRGTERYEVSADLAHACSVPVQLADDTGLMTFQLGSRVAVPYGLLETASDDWLAIAIAHQIAHALLEFAAERIDDPEATADYLGLLLADDAGFDVAAAPAFWEWLARENPWRIAATRAFRIPRPHPTLETDVEYSAAQLHVGIARRLPTIRANVQRILASRGR
jgi:hypothetical protein